MELEVLSGTVTVTARDVTCHQVLRTFTTVTKKYIKVEVRILTTAVIADITALSHLQLQRYHRR